MSNTTVRFWLNFVLATTAMLGGVAIGLGVNYAIIPFMVVAGVLVGVSASHGD